MERIPDPRWEDLLLRVLADIDSGSLPLERFGAAEVRTMGYQGLILFTTGPEQLKYDGFLLRDLSALADLGYASVSWHGESLDVVVLPTAREYQRELRTPPWFRILKRARGAQGPAKYAAAILVGALLAQVANSVIWPWLRNLFGL